MELLGRELGSDTLLIAEVAPPSVTNPTKSDRIWGIGFGLDSDNPHVQDPATWVGRNILGYALMQVLCF